VYDSNCKKLADLYTQAVDYAKNGIPVDITKDFPRPLIKFKPDWSKSEVTGARELDYYESDRALGYLFRNISVDDPSEPVEDRFNTSPKPTAPLEDAISLTIAPLIQRTLNVGIEIPEGRNIQAEGLHARFVREMRAVCMSHALLDWPDVHLTEEEVVLGIILARSVQPRLRKDREYRMRVHADMLVRGIRGLIAPAGESEQTGKEFRDGLQNAWVMWGWAQHHRDKDFIESFSLIALGVILDCLRQLGALPNF
jgi:RNA-dependent RNA polymerase